jgi:DNA-binding NarL/FixJ family response regulator
MQDRTKDANSTTQAVQILVAYPKALTGRLIVDALRNSRNFYVAAHVSSGDAVMAFIKHATIDVVLIAANLDAPGDGLDVLRRLRAGNSEIPAVMLIESPEPQTVVESFRLGAKGVFSMSTGGYELLCKCIQAVHEGQIWASTQELHWVLDSLRDVSYLPSSATPFSSPKALQFKKLSKREIDVVSLLADGLSNRDIARSLNLSENTIKNYLFRIFEKVGVSNRTELLLEAFRFPGRERMELERERSGQSTDAASALASEPQRHGPRPV